jgi:hypothetical protein
MHQCRGMPGRGDGMAVSERETWKRENILNVNKENIK